MWYLPHHPVTYPMKPGKVRIVFDYAAKYHGISLTQQLLQGPNFTNPLVRVLTRFRQETTATAADEEGMFHQASPDGQLNEQPQEYRMAKIVWCYTSLPSVANLSKEYCIDLWDRI